MIDRRNSHSSSVSSFHIPDGEDSYDEIDSPETASCWPSALTICLMNNGCRILGRLAGGLSPSQPLIPSSINNRNLLDRRSVATYFLTLLSLVTIGRGAMGLSGVYPYDIAEYFIPALQSGIRYLIPAGVFVYSFIFNWDRRPPELVQLFLEIAKVRPILIHAIKHEIKDDSEIKKFVALLSQVIDRDGPAGEWFYDGNRISQPDKWKSMRIHSLYLQKKNTGCDVYLMPEFDIKKCEEIKDDAVILTNNDTAYYILNSKITMEDNKPQAVKGINRQQLEFCQSPEPVRLSSEQAKKWQIFKDSIQKGGHVPVIEEHLRDRNQELLKNLKQEISSEDDTRTLQLISLKPLSIIRKKHLETLLDMIDALILANQNYLSPRPFSKIMNRNVLFRYSIFLFVTGSMVVTVMMSLNLSYITTRFLNRYSDHSIAGQIKASTDAAIIIFVSPIAPGLLALWAQFNTVPAFQYRTGIQRLLRCLRGPIGPLSIGKVLDLSILGVSLGLLINQPQYLDQAVLIGSSFSYYAAKFLTSMIPNIFKNCLRRRAQPVKNSGKCSTNSVDRTLNSSMEMYLTQDSGSTNAEPYNEFKFFELKPDFENKYNFAHDNKSFNGEDSISADLT